MAIFLACIAFLTTSTFPGWRQEPDERDSMHDVRPFPSLTAAQAALATASLATLLSLVSILWQHTASVASATTIQDMAYGRVESRVGAAAMALGWLGLAFLFLPSTGLKSEIISIRLVYEMVDQE